MSAIRVVLADDHAILREGLRALLAGAGDIALVGEAASGEDAIEACAQHRPDVVVMDVSMPGLGGLEATLAIRRAQPDVKVLVLTQYSNPEYVQRFLKAGVSGYLLKQTAWRDLAAAIRSVARGGLVLDPEVARSAIAEPASVALPGTPAEAYEALTDREKQVLRLVAEGKSNKDVADALDISIKTAMTHREHLMQKLGLHNRTEIYRFALRAGVVRVDE